MGLNCPRHPFLASEIFGCETSSIQEKFFEAPDTAVKLTENSQNDASDDDPSPLKKRTSEDPTEINQDFPDKKDVAQIQDEEIKVDVEEPSTQDTESTLETHEDTSNKYYLLNRLFKFLRGSKPLNPVLTGYFCKVVISLIKCKINQFIPYIFKKDVFGHLINHLDQKSISEVVIKLMNIEESNFDQELAEQIKLRKQAAIAKFIEKLSSQHDEEENMNAGQVLTELLDVTEFCAVVARKPNILKLCELSFESSTVASRNAAKNVLEKLLLKINQKKGANPNVQQGDEDEIIIKQDSDDEQESVNATIDASVIESLSCLVPKIKDLLIQTTPAPIQCVYDTARTVPLGSERLKAVELLQQIIKLNKQSILIALSETQILQVLLGLVQQFQWNNILQLKVITIFEDLLLSNNTKETKIEVIRDSDVLERLVDMAQRPNHRLAQSDRIVRAGYMGLVVKLANLIIKTNDKDQLNVISSENQGWSEFVSGELEESNNTNAKSLGGRPRSNEKEEEEDTTFDVSMEKIMSRFNTFNSLMSNQSNNDDEEDEDESHEEQVGYEEPAEAEEVVPITITPKTFVEKHIEVEVPSERSLESQYTDASYWKVTGCEDDLDELLKDFE